MTEKITVGEAVTKFLVACEVKAAFGVISIHNIPILDAIYKNNQIRWVMARGELGAVNMADSFARTTGKLGIVITSTGPGAGNTAGSMVEALTAGTPLLHITGQIESKYLDQELFFLHEAPQQLKMLEAISKYAFRVRNKETALSTFKKAVQTALTSPTGPVSIEIPINIQKEFIEVREEDFYPLEIPQFPVNKKLIKQLAEELISKKRPMLWLGGGARKSEKAVKRFINLGFGVVTTTQGRGVVSEDNEQSLGAYNIHPAVESFYQTCDCVLIVGSKLRSYETLDYKLKFPKHLFRIDINPLADGRGFNSDIFICGDSSEVLNLIADEIEGKINIDNNFILDLKNAYQTARNGLLKSIGSYEKLIKSLQNQIGRNFNWVRDVTIANSLWGDRELKVFDSKAGVHALGIGIGQGLAMGIGAAVGSSVYDKSRKTIVLSGDGGFILNLGELATAVQEKVQIVFILMNDKKYGILNAVQKNYYEGKTFYTDLHTPDYAKLSESLGLNHTLVKNFDNIDEILKNAFTSEKPFLLEIDVLAINQISGIVLRDGAIDY